MFFGIHYTKKVNIIVFLTVKKINDKCMRQKTWSCVVLWWSMTLGGCHGGGTKISWSGFCSVGTLQHDFVVDLFGLWVCSGQCNWRVCLCGIGWLCSEKQSDRLGASIKMDCPILGLCVLCMFFSVVGSNKTWQRKFSSDFTRALRKCLFYKLQRPAII